MKTWLITAMIAAGLAFCFTQQAHSSTKKQNRPYSIPNQVESEDLPLEERMRLNTMGVIGLKKANDPVYNELDRPEVSYGVSPRATDRGSADWYQTDTFQFNSSGRMQ